MSEADGLWISLCLGPSWWRAGTQSGELTSHPPHRVGSDLPFGWISASGQRPLSGSVTGLREALLLIAERSAAVRGSRSH